VYTQQQEHWFDKKKVKKATEKHLHKQYFVFFFCLSDGRKEEKSPSDPRRTNTAAS